MVKTRILRGIVIAISILGAIAIVFGFLPGIDVYRDTSDCFGQAFASLFSHASSRGCESSWKLVESAASRRKRKRGASRARRLSCIVPVGSDSGIDCRDRESASVTIRLRRSSSAGVNEPVVKTR